MSRFMSSRFDSLEEYVPGEQPRDRKYIKLNTNESPYPPSDGVLKAVSSGESELLNLYPDPTAKELKEKLAQRYELKPENVFVSNGSDETLSFAFMAFCDKNHGVAFADITYGFYEVYAALYGIDAKVIPLNDALGINPDDYIGLDRMIVIANPNAPTGRVISLNDIARIAESNPKNIVLIDEAYVDFGAESCLCLLSKYKNLLIVRTYSKSRSLAGARVGFALGDAEVISDLEKIKYSTNPYNMNRLTLVAASRAIDDDSYYFGNAEMIADTRKFTACELKKLGFEMTDSYANFIFVEHKDFSGEMLYSELKKRGILIRHLSKERIRNFNRITIGTKEEMCALIDALKDIMQVKES